MDGIYAVTQLCPQSAIAPRTLSLGGPADKMLRGTPIQQREGACQILEF